MANIAREGAPKRSQADLAPAFGMSKVSKSGPVTLGGDHSSALDSLTGRETVPGTYPEGLTAGPPLAEPPVAKVHNAPLRPVMGHRSRLGEVGPGEVGEHVSNPAKQFVPNDLGVAILDEAGVHAKTYDDFNNRMAAANKQ